jgi:hypothetical protein
MYGTINYNLCLLCWRYYAPVLEYNLLISEIWTVNILHYEERVVAECQAKNKDIYFLLWRNCQIFCR